MSGFNFAVVTSQAMIPQTRPETAPTMQPILEAFFQVTHKAANGELASFAKMDKIQTNGYDGRSEEYSHKCLPFCEVMSRNR